jgi:DNA end-binding protein Ku
LHELLKEKAKGNKIVAAKEERPTGTNVVDLMDALRKSVKGDKAAKEPSQPKSASAKGSDKSPSKKKAGTGRR